MTQHKPKLRLDYYYYYYYFFIGLLWMKWKTTFLHNMDYVVFSVTMMKSFWTTEVTLLSRYQGCSLFDPLNVSIPNQCCQYHNELLTLSSFQIVSYIYRRGPVGPYMIQFLCPVGRLANYSKLKEWYMHSFLGLWIHRGGWSQYKSDLITFCWVWDMTCKDCSKKFIVK